MWDCGGVLVGMTTEIKSTAQHKALEPLYALG